MLTGCWYSVLSLYMTLKNLENVENYIRTCGGGAGILLFLLSSKIRLNMGSFSYNYSRSNRHGLLSRTSLGWWTIFSGLRSCTVHVLNLNIARSQYAITCRMLALSNTCLISRDTLFWAPFLYFFQAVSRKKDWRNCASLAITITE